MDGLAQGRKTINLYGLNKTCPCRHCLNRAVGCHGCCKHYATWSEERKRQSENIQNKKKLEAEEWDHVREAGKRMHRRKEPARK